MVLGTVVPAFAAVDKTTAVAEAGKTVTLTFTYDNIKGIEGFLEYSNPGMFSNIALTQSGLGSGMYIPAENHFIYHDGNLATSVITLTLTIANTAVAGDTCTVTLKYETTQSSSLPSVPNYMTDTVVVSVEGGPVDYSRLTKLISKAGALDQYAFESATWTAMQSALTAATAALTSDDQDVVDAAANTLEAAIGALDPLEFAELNNQINLADRMDMWSYTTDSWNNMLTAKAAAIAAKTSCSQATIDLAAQNLKNAIAALQLLPPLNYAELNKQIARAEALVKEDYTTASWNLMTAALKTAMTVRSVHATQADVDHAARELTDAIDELVKIHQDPVIDYSELNKQIARAEALVKTNYTASSYADLTAPLAAAKAAQSSNNQTAVNKAAVDLATAIDALVAMDFTEVDKQIRIAQDLTKGNYTDASWAAMQTALNAAISSKTSCDQNTVNNAAVELRIAIALLQKNAVIDYSELNKQIAIAEALKAADYTTATWNNLTSALKAAKAALESTNQGTVDSSAVTLAKAIASLEKTAPVVNYTELNKQIAIAEGLVSSDYTAETWKSLTAALKAAKDVTDSQSQAVVDAAATGLKNAIAALVKMNLEALDAANKVVSEYAPSEKIAQLWMQMHELMAAADEAARNGDQKKVDECAAAMTKLLEDIKAEMEELNKVETIEKEVLVPTEPTDDFCNQGGHRVWPVIAWISVVLNVGAAALIVVYFVLKKKKESDNTPLVDYDITDDAQ